MTARVLALGAAAVLGLGGSGAGSSFAAPLQCGSSDPSMRLEDDAGESLWNLATQFDREGNRAAAVETWRYLAERYPANRHADDARRLAGESPAPPPPSSPAARRATDAG